MRFVVPLALVLALFAFAIVPLIENLTLRWFVRDLDARSKLVASALEDPLATYVRQQNQRQINQLFDRAIKDERLYAVAFCNPAGKLVHKTVTYNDAFGCRAEDEAAQLAPEPLPTDGVLQAVVTRPEGMVHLTQSPVRFDGEAVGTLMLVHDMNYIEERADETRQYVIGLFALLAVVISLMTMLIAHLSWQGWINAVKGILRGNVAPRPQPLTPPEIRPLEGDLRALLNEFNIERRARDDNFNHWTPDRLRMLLHDELAGDEVLVVSNREPYMHVHGKNGVEVRRPASGLVTAVEPVMRACSGTWIAHGSGSADRETVDHDDRVPVPPHNPGYTLRRVWMNKEEEAGYYYGFSNEGLWPLCHIAHVRPVFRSSDWEQYVAINQRFADAVIKEARTDDPVVLVQDYHFALLPQMVREVLPKATVITFWHIPWPNPESFGICPWREEILEGLLGSTILGFHTPFHRKNFLETVDRYLETRIEHEASTISYGGKLTQVEDYPISIDWPDNAELPSVKECRETVRQELGLPANHLVAVGVDRLDYTKGIMERFQAVERMLEMHPELAGRFTLVQIAAPSRSSLDEYQNFEARVRALVQRINSRFSNGAYQPILLKAEHHGADEVRRYYRAAEVCMVTSLHDGMNLVAKEFIGARDDEQGVLVLSQFTGAARELHEALIINPYHIEQGADALYRGLTMPEVEQCERMHSMRSLVRNFNVYRWAGRMLLDAARLRQRERIMSKIRLHSRKSLRRIV
jgi:trehalose-6-phosphate synthase